MKKILVISWFYPPVNSSEGLVTYKLLRKSKYSYDVFTQKKVDLWSYGNKDYLPESANIKCIYSKAEDLNQWKKDAIEYFKKNKDKYDIIMTRSMPPESHVIGIEIKKIKPEIIWIASFGDPIANNPYTKLAIKEYNPWELRSYYRLKIRNVISPRRIAKNCLFKRHIRKVNKQFLSGPGKLEDDILKKADYYIFNSEEQKEYMLQKYGEKEKNKGVVLNHSYAEDLYPELAEKNDDRIVMTYVGGLDDIRTPRLLFEAIKRLKEDDEELSKKIVFNFYGSLSDKDKLYVINEELTDVIHVRKNVKYLDSLKIMKNSDWLMLIDANITEVQPKNIFFAAKLADNIGAKTKILGITMQEGVSANILRKINGLLLTYSIEEIRNYLWLIIYKGYKVEINKEACKEFDSVEVAKKFDKLVDDINSKI